MMIPDLTMICYHHLVLNCICAALFISLSFEQDNGMEVRLTGGSLGYPNGPWLGIVSVKWYTIWGTVCQDRFDINDAHVICRQLGYEGAVSTSYGVNNYKYQESNQGIILDELGCDGRENNLAYCPGSFGSHDCLGSLIDAVGVECNQTRNSIKFRGSFTLDSIGGGLLEWLPALSNPQSSEFREVTNIISPMIQQALEAKKNTRNGLIGVRIVSYRPGSIIVEYEASYTLDSSVSEDQVKKSLKEAASTNNFGRLEVDPKSISSVSALNEITPPNEPTYVSVRLSGGDAPWLGVVEVSYMGFWGVICDWDWNQEDGDVVCRQLGYRAARRVTTLSEWDPNIWAASPHNALESYKEKRVQIDQVICKGTEEHLAECTLTPFGLDRFRTCDAENSVMVECETDEKAIDIETREGTGVTKMSFEKIRLTDIQNPYQGLVQVLYNNQWGYVCDDNWDINDGQVVCTQLGYPHVSSITTLNSLGVEIGFIVLDDVHCDGSEANLNQCDGLLGLSSHDCALGELAGVVCALGVDPSPTVRLANGNDPWDGRVEVYYHGQWGTVCDDEWTFEDANVVCRQLGYSQADNTFDLSIFGTASDDMPILLDNTRCSGTESRLTDCGGLWGENMHNCDHSEDAGVRCNPRKGLPEIRLIGSYPNQGRVEIYLNHEWGTICDDDWDIYDAQVVCHQLGFPAAITVSNSADDFMQGSGAIHLDDVHCDGTEESVAYCSHSGIGINNCNHMEDAGVLCDSDRYPNEIIRDGAGEDGGLGFTLLGIAFIFGMLLTFCFCCRKVCRSNTRNAERTTTTVVPQANNPYTAALENRQQSYLHNRMNVPVAMPLLHGPGADLMVTIPSAPPDLPPAYDSVMEDPSKFAFPPGQITTENPRVPLTPPPEYTPEAVVFNVNSNSVTMTTGSMSAGTGTAGSGTAT